MTVTLLATACVKESTAPQEQDNPNWRITATNWDDRNDLTGEISRTSNYFGTGNLQVGQWDCENIGTGLDTIGYAEFTIKTWDGLAITDISNIGFSSAGNFLLTPAGSLAAWGAGISDPTTVNLIPGPPHNRDEFYVPLLPSKPGDLPFSARAVVTFVANNANGLPIKTGKIQIGIRMFNPRTQKFTTVNPVWGKICVISKENVTITPRTGSYKPIEFTMISTGKPAAN